MGDISDILGRIGYIQKAKLIITWQDIDCYSLEAKTHLSSFSVYNILDPIVKECDVCVNSRLRAVTISGAIGCDSDNKIE